MPSLELLRLAAGARFASLDRRSLWLESHRDHVRHGLSGK
jgi:hypothetical protein